MTNGFLCFSPLKNVSVTKNTLVQIINICNTIVQVPRIDLIRNKHDFTVRLCLNGGLREEPPAGPGNQVGKVSLKLKGS